MARKFLSGLFGKKQKPEAPEVLEPEVLEKDSEPIEQNHDGDGPAQSIDTDDSLSTNASEAARLDRADIDAQEVEREPSKGDETEIALEEISQTANPIDEPISELVSEPVPAPPAELEAEPEPEQKPKRGFFSRLTQGLSRTSNRLTDGVSSIFTKKKLDDDMLEELENLLITADLGVGMASRFTADLAREKFDKEITDQEVRAELAVAVTKTLTPCEVPLSIHSENRPHIILMAGVNGAGKTTTIGKLAAKFQAEGRSVMLAAGDTFRAAAIEQLAVWGERSGVPVIAREFGADAAGLAFDAIEAAREQNIDVLMIDTAGRLQNRTELMDELSKIVRVIQKLDDTAPHDSLLVLDATVGQNAISQVEAFKDAAKTSGLIMTKLDGTARGGVLVALAEKFELPVQYIGVGEGVHDLQPFNAQAFARALTGVDGE